MRYFLAPFFILLTTFPALAGSSDWYETDGAKIRLVALPSASGNRIDAGLQIELDKGWKTYWRSPGASGLPPQLDFSGSKNIAATKIEYPIPTTFGDKKNLTVGYKSSVTLPIAVEPLFQGRPVTINATGVIGICEEICVPVQFQLSVTENGSGVSTADVSRALFASRVNLMQPPRDDFKVNSAKLSKKMLKIEASVPLSSENSTLMVEGPSDWYLTPVKATSVSDGKATFEIDLSDIPKDAKPEQTELIFSLVNGKDGIEQKMVPSL